MSEFTIIWRGTNNFWPGRDGHSPIAIVDHIMQSSIESADGWFKNPKSEVSAHFGVAKDGRIWQWVAVTNSAWANGPINNPDKSIQWIVDADKHNINPNRLTISIEHEGKTGELFTQKQYDATLWLHQKLIKENNIALDGKHIIGHFQLDSVTRPNCPGKGFPWEQLLMDLQNTVGRDPSGGFSVGPGALAVLKAHGLVAAGNENYYKDGAGQQVSLVYTTTPGYRVVSTFSPANPGGGWLSDLVKVVE